MRRGASATSNGGNRGNGGNEEKRDEKTKEKEENEKEEEENERADIVFSSAVSCLLFDLRIWARGSYEVHGNVLADMHVLLHSDSGVAEGVDVQGLFDSLQDLYGGSYSAASRVSMTSESVRQGWNEIDFNDRSVGFFLFLFYFCLYFFFNF